MHQSFADYYRTISNPELLDILSNPQHYQPEALEAAKAELSFRNLSEEELQRAREILKSKQNEKIKQKEKIQAIEDKIKQPGRTFYDTFNPFNTETPKAERTIRAILIVFTALYLYDIFRNYRAFIYAIENFSAFFFENVIVLMPNIFLPVALFTFWKRKNYGWILFATYLAFSATSVLWGLFYLLFIWSPKAFQLSGMEVYRPSYISYFMNLLLYAGTLVLISRENIRTVFSISKKEMTATIMTAAALAVLLIFYVYNRADS